MNAIRYTGRTKKLQFINIPVPTITEANQVLIKVAYAGVCGTDIHIMTGEFPCSNETFTLGHEFSGTVIDVGLQVKNVKCGDRVSINPTDGCQCCTHCTSGNPHYCETNGIRNTIGIHRNGGWASYAVVPMFSVHKLPNTVTLEEGVLGEPLSCISHGWDMLSPVPIGSRILIIGAGVIGNLWICLLHLQGFKDVTISEPNLNRLNLVKNLNTGYDLITPEQLRTNHDRDPDYLFDVVIDCSGFCPAIEQGLNLLDRGGKLCCFGIGHPNASFKVPSMEIFLKEIQILAVNTNPFSFPKSLAFIKAMGQRYLEYKKLGIEIFDLDDHQRAFDMLKKGHISKAVFKL